MDDVRIARRAGAACRPHGQKLARPAFLATAVKGALAAGRLQRRHSSALTVHKGAIDLVTGSVAVGAQFRAMIAAFSDHHVLGEEGGVVIHES